MGILNQIGAVFVPVSNIVNARDWYCRLLGLEPVEVLFGHLAVLPVQEGSGLVLDSKDFAGPHDRKPIFHFDTRDVQSAHAQLEQLGADALGPITDGVFFTFKDPDGNLLMVADVPAAPRS
jgi:catechol 2,3-dioxygenase-like lactoylglutathione lyase family enzyme